MKKREKIKEYQKEIIRILSFIGKNQNLMKEFLKDILTPTEFDEVSLRWQIIKKLEKGDKHRDIAGELGLGISTVTRGSRELRNKNGGFALVLKKLKG